MDIRAADFVELQDNDWWMVWAKSCGAFNDERNYFDVSSIGLQQTHRPFSLSIDVLNDY